ncbi:hypothetical protein KC19_VG291900 [Ceratodon purpureus]|uniref:Uncharacterized protein n=1 Tax=Ceratodon purpureus TaxID=3225 RepID=A0A8T0HUX3_CERPU|nr:hypothetical protein KC19_VG291900 [Ceratodon purpureus]
MWVLQFLGWWRVLCLWKSFGRVLEEFGKVFVGVWEGSGHGDWSSDVRTWVQWTNSRLGFGFEAY